MSSYVQSPTSGSMSDRDVLNALMQSPRRRSSAYERDRLERNIILPKSAGLPHRRTEQSIDIQQMLEITDPYQARSNEIANVDDTVHYLSPATGSPLSARSVNEGDFYVPYKSPSFMKFLHTFGVHEASYASSTISCVEPDLQRTLAIVKPEAMEYKDVIVRAIKEAGFTIIRKRHIHLTPEQVSEIYAQYYGSPAFPYMVVKMSVGPILSLCLAGVNAVEKWKNIVGPERALRSEWFYPISMRVRFGLRDDMSGAVHASDSLPEAVKENRYVNPESILEPIIMEENKVWDFCSLYINSTLLDGLAEVVRAKPLDPIMHLANWLLKNNQYQPRFPPQVSVLPT